MRGCRPLTDSEIDTLLEHFSAPEWKREKAFFLIGIRTGLRLSTILSLRLEDVSLCGRVRDRIRVRRATTKGRRSGFDLVFHKQAAAGLQEYLDTLEENSGEGFVFRGRRFGTRLHRTQGWRLIKAAFEKAGISGGYGETGVHTLRKTFARLVYSALNHDLVKTAYAMRHASVSTTVQYLPSMRRRLIGRFWRYKLLEAFTHRQM
jgi:integrase